MTFDCVRPQLLCSRVCMGGKECMHGREICLSQCSTLEDRNECSKVSQLMWVRHAVFTGLSVTTSGQAQELCLKCGQPWKAEVLEGWRLHHDPNFGKGAL